MNVERDLLEKVVADRVQRERERVKKRQEQLNYIMHMYEIVKKQN